MNQSTLIVSRHPAAIEFIASQLGGEYRPNAGHVVFPDDSFLPVVPTANAELVRGRVVYGNLPLHLAALCESVTAIEFNGVPPRGQEYGLEQMLAAGATLRSYSVCPA